MKDKNGKPLTPEEEDELENDILDEGIPGSKEGGFRLWEKWGERLGHKKPEGYDDWAIKQIIKGP